MFLVHCHESVYIGNFVPADSLAEVYIQTNGNAYHLVPVAAVSFLMSSPIVGTVGLSIEPVERTFNSECPNVEVSCQTTVDAE